MAQLLCRLLCVLCAIPLKVSSCLISVRSVSVASSGVFSEVIYADGSVYIDEMMMRAAWYVLVAHVSPIP